MILEEIHKAQQVLQQLNNKARSKCEIRNFI